MARIICPVLDAAANNACIIMQKNGYRSFRKEFLKMLTLDVATSSVQSRLCKLNVRNSVRKTATQMGISTSTVTRGLQHSLKPNLPKRCTVCKKTLAGNAGLRYCTLGSPLTEFMVEARYILPARSLWFCNKAYN